jgi:hypothetical protein
MSANDPSTSQPEDSQRIRFYPKIFRAVTSPDRKSYLNSTSYDDDVKSPLLPQPGGDWPNRRPRSGNWWKANRGLMAAMALLSMLFGTIIWHNYGCESVFCSVVKRTAQGIQGVKEVFLLDKDSNLQHGFMCPGGWFCSCLSAFPLLRGVSYGGFSALLGGSCANIAFSRSFFG